MPFLRFRADKGFQELYKPKDKVNDPRSTKQRLCPTQLAGGRSRPQRLAQRGGGLYEDYFRGDEI